MEVVDSAGGYESISALPAGWVRYISEDPGQEGWPYYFHEATGVSQWEFPDDIQQQSMTKVPINEIPTVHTNVAITGAAQVNPQNADAEDLEEMINFFKSTCSLSHLAARTAASESIARRISTPKKLAKIWGRQSLQLSDLQLDEDDAEEVAVALRVILATAGGVGLGMHTQSSITEAQELERMRHLQMSQYTSSYALSAGNTLGYDTATALQVPGYGGRYAPDAAVVARGTLGATRSSSSTSHAARMYALTQRQDMSSLPAAHYQTHTSKKGGSGRHSNNTARGGRTEEDGDLEFYESESVYTHSTRGSLSQKGSHMLKSGGHSRAESRSDVGMGVDVAQEDMSMWIECSTPSGQLYYYNEATKMVQWNNPHVSHQQHVASYPKYFASGHDTGLPNVATESTNTHMHRRGVLTTESVPFAKDSLRSDGPNDVDEDDSVSDLSSGSESRQRRSRSHDKRKKGRDYGRQRRMPRHSGLANGGVTTTLPKQYSETLERVKAHSESDAVSRVSGSRKWRNLLGGNSVASNRSGGQLSTISKDLPQMHPRSLEVWNRFFENALKAKADPDAPDRRIFNLPVMARNEWPLPLGESEFANMIDTITMQSPGNARDNNMNIALLYAILEGDMVVAERLLQLGADPNATDQLGRTPMHYVAKTGLVDAAAMIFNNGGDPDQADEHLNVPLHTACIFGSRRVVRYLLESAVAVDSVDLDGNTAMHFCAHAELEATNCCKLLLDYEAKPATLNAYGQTALDYARKVHNDQIVDPQLGSGLSAYLHLLHRIYTELNLIDEPKTQQDFAIGASKATLQDRTDSSVSQRSQTQQHMPVPLSGSMEREARTRSFVVHPPPAPLPVVSSPPAKSPNRNKPAWTGNLTVALSTPVKGDDEIVQPHSEQRSASPAAAIASRRASPSSVPARHIDDVQPMLKVNPSDAASVYRSVTISPRGTPVRTDVSTEATVDANTPRHIARTTSSVVPAQNIVDDNWMRDVGQRLWDRMGTTSIGEAQLGHVTVGAQHLVRQDIGSEIDSSENIHIGANAESKIAMNAKNNNFAEGSSVGEAVVGGLWATASSLIGVTLSMFQGDVSSDAQQSEMSPEAIGREKRS